MSITYPLSLPKANIATIRITPRFVTAVSESPYSLTQQTYAHQGQCFLAEVTLPSMQRADRDVWTAFFLRLQGRVGTFLMGDPDAPIARGAATGTPLVKGASQTGTELITDGWTAGVTGILKAGDYIQLGSGSTAYLHKIMEDATSDVSGDATLKIFPRLRVSPADNAPIVVASCLGRWRLTSDEAGAFEVDHAGISSPLTFGAIEAI